MPLENVASKSLKGEIAVNVAKEAVIMTDELSSYLGLEDDGYAGHETGTGRASTSAKASGV
jgi:hypothetical protein